MPDQTAILAWGCVFLGAWLVGYALYSMKVGRPGVITRIIDTMPMKVMPGSAWGVSLLA